MEAAIVIIVIGVAGEVMHSGGAFQNIRLVIFRIGFFAFPCALIVFESINLIWHMGTYYHYPMRCGYLAAFSLLSCASAFCADIFCG